MILARGIHSIAKKSGINPDAFKDSYSGACAKEGRNVFALTMR
jgi:hypothetical protein